MLECRVVGPGRLQLHRARETLSGVHMWCRNGQAAIGSSMRSREEVREPETEWCGLTSARIPHPRRHIVQPLSHCQYEVLSVSS